MNGQTQFHLKTGLVFYYRGLVKLVTFNFIQYNCDIYVTNLQNNDQDDKYENKCSSNG